MRLRLILGFAVIAAQLGCGGTEAPSELASREDPLLRCITEHFIVYYSDGTYTTPVGSERCFCERTPTREGIRTDFEEIQSMYECNPARPVAP